MQIITDQRTFTLIRSGDVEKIKNLVGMHTQEVVHPVTGTKVWANSVLTDWTPTPNNAKVVRVLKFMQTELFAYMFTRSLENQVEQEKIVVAGIDFDSASNLLSFDFDNGGHKATGSFILDYSGNLDDQIMRLARSYNLPKLQYDK